MFIFDPTKVSQFDHARLMSGYLQNRLEILEHALKYSHKRITPVTLESAAKYASEATEIPITTDEFAKLIQLYPYAAAKLAEHGWDATEVCELVLDVVANAFLGTRWPRHIDKECDLMVFMKHLKTAYEQAKPLLNEYR